MAKDPTTTDNAAKAPTPEAQSPAPAQQAAPAAPAPAPQPAPAPPALRPGVRRATLAQARAFHASQKP